MKKFLSLALAFAMTVSAAALVSCGNDSTDTVSNQPGGSGSVTTSAPDSSKPADSSTPAESGENTDPATPGSSAGVPVDPLWEALLKLYRPYADAAVENVEEFKADAKNQDLMDEYFDSFNFDFSIYSGFDYTDSEDETQIQFGKQDAPNLFDNDVNTKWCVDAAQSEFANAVVWNMTQKVKVTGYSLTTGEDNATYTARGPITWRLYGTNELPSAKMSDINEAHGDTYFETYTVPEGWTLVDAVDAADPNGDGLTSLVPDVNFYEALFSLSKECEFQYFMLMIDTNENNCIQISEVTLYGTPVEG